MSDEENPAADLMNALIDKMERMDTDLDQIRKQNRQLRQILSDPAVLLKRAGFVRNETPAIEDVWGDPLRGSDAIVKTVEGETFFDVPNTTEEFYDVEWDDIHALADQAKSLGHVGNIALPTEDNA